MKELLSGNEAIARGAYEANVWVMTGYPGTPSTEIIETVSEAYPEIKSEWSVNEKVALEIALGSSIAGVRSVATMKHVGLNVAADPFMTAAYTGVNAGLVIVVADDPGLHSSQNEQDTRNFAKFAKVPLFEPSDSSDAKKFLKIGLDVSEQFDTVSVLRPVTRVAHTKTAVEQETPVRELPADHYKKNAAKYVMVPANAGPRHRIVLDRYEKLKAYSEKFKYHRSEVRGEKIGVITHGLIYHYVREALPEASVFSVGMYPIPLEKIRKFASKVKKLYVIEELDPVIEEELRAHGIKLTGKEIIPSEGELSVDIIRNAFAKPDKKKKTDKTAAGQSMMLPGRPPVLCKGCGHIPVFETLRDMQVTVLGDIGCYTLGVLPPFNSMDTTICMGASIGNEIGFKKAGQLRHSLPKSVAVIGDSTFFHSGMTGLLNAVYNQTPITVMILDNRITAMTGHQPNCSTCLDNKFERSGDVKMEDLVKGLGVKRVRRVNAYKKDEIKLAVTEELASGEVSVIIVDEICVVGEARLKKAAEMKKKP
jgi:indolepyruvate ferredoxin oxidoreductase alpha subunit